MNPWLETTGVILIAVLGVFSGRIFSRLRRPYWVLGYILPALLIAMLAMVRFDNSLYFVPPFSWITVGRVRFVVLSLAVWICDLVFGAAFPRTGVD